MSEVTIECRHLTKTFGEGHTAVNAVNDVDLSIKAGEMVLITGPSGSGKTTLLSMLGTLLGPTAGDIDILGQNTSKLSGKVLAALRARSIGFVFQAFNLMEALTVEENILFPTALIDEDKAKTRTRSETLVQRLKLTQLKHKLPNNLSGGEKQRVAIARALINDPPIILADEPTGNLDSKSGQEVMMILHDIARDFDRTILMVTHDPRVEEIADRILWLEDGAIRDRKDEAHSWVQDPVCHMRVDQWTTEIKSEFEGHTYFFCSDNCKHRFETNSDQFLNA